eukprot:scaffold2368_cov289-Chaetoceros_neogracile.AAC.4
MSSIPGPLIIGTIIYAVIGASLLAAVIGARATGMMSKDNAACNNFRDPHAALTHPLTHLSHYHPHYSIGHVVVTIAVFFSWMFWLCAWLHQWHPLIKPIYEGGE